MLVAIKNVLVNLISIYCNIDDVAIAYWVSFRRFQLDNME